VIINTPAIVLKSFPYGETSLITRCFTKEKGKVSFIVRGARSKKSSKFSHFQPMSYIDIIYNHKPKNELQTIS
jgi:DNA repair protein RecO (recombination protein O)